MVVFVRIGCYDYYMHGCKFGGSAWSFVDRGASQGNLSARRRSGGHGAVENGCDNRRNESAGTDAYHALRHDSPLSKSARDQIAEETGGQGRAQGPSSAT